MAIISIRIVNMPLNSKYLVGYDCIRLGIKPIQFPLLCTIGIQRKFMKME